VKIGVGVEGPSDLNFWSKVLHRELSGCRFDIRNMKNRDKLIRETPKLFEQFKDLHYDAGFILVDRDRNPCVTSVYQEFDQTVRQEARRQDGRCLFICVAVRELEAWFLADASAINSILPKVNYVAPPETGHAGTKTRIKELLRQQHGPDFGYNEIFFAKQIAPKFSPARAIQHSRSFRYFWERIAATARPA